MKVFINVGSNNAGGAKNANHMANLFREKGFESYVVLPQETYKAQWMIKPAPVINIGEMKRICEKEDLIIDRRGHADVISTLRRLEARAKVFYTGGATFLRSTELLGDLPLRRGKELGYTHFWGVSDDSINYMRKAYPTVKKWHKVSPLFDFELSKNVMEGVKRRRQILCLTRKGERYVRTVQLFFHKKIRFKIIDRNYTEKAFYEWLASSLFFLHTATGVDTHLEWLLNALSHHFANAVFNGEPISTAQYLLKRTREPVFRPLTTQVIHPIDRRREGFPLPAAEAAMCGAVVVGFAMGGGLEWMDETNCFLAEDLSYVGLVDAVKRALCASPRQLDIMRSRAYQSIGKFGKEHTWRQLQRFLNDLP